MASVPARTLSGAKAGNSLFTHVTPAPTMTFRRHSREACDGADRRDGQRGDSGEDHAVPTFGAR
jgi:hypothetical protein